jgi:hypothetical protein
LDFGWRPKRFAIKWGVGGQMAWLSDEQKSFNSQVNTSNSKAETKGNSTSTKSPSFTCLVVGLGMLAIFCASLYFRNPTFASICVGFYCFFSIALSPEGDRTLKSRDYFWVVVGIAAFAAFLMLVGRREFPAVEIFVARPIILVTLWLLLSAFSIWVWCVRRSKGRLVEKKP